MNPSLNQKSLKKESVVTSKKKSKDKKQKPKDHGNIRIIDDDAPVLWDTTAESGTIAEDEIVSTDDAPVIVGMNVVFCFTL